MTKGVDNFEGYPHPIHIFLLVMHILMIVLGSILMLQYFYIKQNADLIKSFHALGGQIRRIWTSRRIGREIQVDEIEYGRVMTMIV